MKAIELNETERGHVLLTHAEEFYLNSYTRLPEGRWLEVTYRSDNYPSYSVRTIEVSDAALADHITREFGGGMWYARKMNLAGVKVDQFNYVVGAEDEE